MLFRNNLKNESEAVIFLRNATNSNLKHLCVIMCAGSLIEMHPILITAPKIYIPKHQQMSNFKTRNRHACIPSMRAF